MSSSIPGKHRRYPHYFFHCSISCSILLLALLEPFLSLYISILCSPVYSTSLLYYSIHVFLSPGKAPILTHILPERRVTEQKLMEHVITSHISEETLSERNKRKVANREHSLVTFILVMHTCLGRRSRSEGREWTFIMTFCSQLFQFSRCNKLTECVCENVVHDFFYVVIFYDNVINDWCYSWYCYLRFNVIYDFCYSWYSYLWFILPMFFSRD